MNDLQILILGSPEIRWKGESFPIQRRTTRALLFYLAARGGMVARNELLLAFWQDQSPTQARTRLRETLSRLRKELPISDLILTTNDLVGLNFERVFVDQREFDRLADAFGQMPWKIPIKDPLPADILQNMMAAARLWRGPRYLAGAELPSSYEMDNWLTLTSQRYEQFYRQIFERLSYHFEAQGDWQQAVRYAERVIENDHLNENIYARILDLLIASGQVELARNYYRQIEALFTQEFGAPPGEQFAGILQRLQLAQPPKQRSQLPENWLPRQILDAPFVGRKNILAQLWQCYQKNISVFLSGETGIGKTRLLHEFFQRQQIASRLIASRCTPETEESPFQSTLDSEREYGHIRKHFHQIPAIYARQILRLLPELAELRPELLEEDTTPTISEQQLTLEASRQFLLAITQTQPILFVIEDIQWMDTFTLNSIDYVIKRYPFGSKAMMILTGRADECPPATLKAIRTWMASGYMSQIEVERLNPGDVNSLASAVLPAPPSSEFIAQLAADTGGNPCYILEILRQALQQTPDLDVSKALSLPLSTQLSVIIHNRIEALTPPARQVFDVAAVIGVEFNSEVALLSLSMDRSAFERSLEELEARGLISATPETIEARYRFTHEKFREILLADLKPLRKQQLHQQVAGALIAIYGEKIPRTTLAHHAQQAGDRVKAFEYVLAAGLEAYQTSQVKNASDLFAQATGLVERDGKTFTPEALYRLYRPWLNALIAQNDFVTCWQVCDEILALGQKCGDSLLIGVAFSTQALLHLHQQALEQGLAATQQALPYLEQVNNPYEYMNVHNTRATLLYMAGRIDEAVQMYQRALVIAESVDKPSADLTIARSFTHENLCTIYHIYGWPKRGHQHAQHALAAAIETQNLLRQASAYGYLTFACYHLGEYAQARMYNDFGLRLARQTGHVRELGYHHMYRSWIELTLGNLAASLQHAGLSRENGTQTQEPLMIALAERCYADTYLALNQPALALTYYQHALSYLPPGIASLDIVWRIGYTQAFLGQTEQVSALLQQTITQAEKYGADFIKLEAQICVAWLLLRQGDFDSACQLAQTVQAETEKRSLFKEHTTTMLLLGEISWQTQQLDEARGYFEAVAEKSALHNYPWQEIRSRIALGRILQSQNRALDAQEHRVKSLLDQIESTITEKDQLPDGQSLKKVFASYRKSLPQLRI